MLSGLEPLAASPAAFVVVVLLGLLWGSFANVCIYRWPPSDAFPHGRSVVTPGSHCFACGTPIRWYDNVPLLAWLWLRGKCRTCGAAFSARYLFVEALTGALFGVAWWFAVVAQQGMMTFDQQVVHFVVYAGFCFVMIVVTFIDLDHKLILNKLMVPAMAVFYAASFLWPERHWYDGLVGAAVGYGIVWSIAEIYYRITQREGMGLGDGMLLAAVGALLGWRGVLVALFGGSAIGAVTGITGLIVGWASGEGDEDEHDAATSDEPPVAAGAPIAERAAAGDAGEPGAPPSNDGEQADEKDAGLRSQLRMEIPFGPFLAIAALIYLFAEPWFQLHFHMPYW